MLDAHHAVAAAAADDTDDGATADDDDDDDDAHVRTARVRFPDRPVAAADAAA